MYKIVISNAVTGEVIGIGYTGELTESKAGNAMYRLCFKAIEGLKKFQVNGFMTVCKPKSK